jgi:hypothetical protein
LLGMLLNFAMLGAVSPQHRLIYLSTICAASSSVSFS